jgi:hypothetical protein
MLGVSIDVVLLCFVFGVVLLLWLLLLLLDGRYSVCYVRRVCVGCCSSVHRRHIHKEVV